MFLTCAKNIFLVTVVCNFNKQQAYLIVHYLQIVYHSTLVALFIIDYNVLFCAKLTMELRCNIRYHPGRILHNQMYEHKYSLR